jgi:hypothetical protein
LTFGFGKVGSGVRLFSLEYFVAFPVAQRNFVGGHLDLRFKYELCDVFF